MSSTISKPRRLQVLLLVSGLTALLWFALISPLQEEFQRVDTAILDQRSKIHRLNETLGELSVEPNGIGEIKGLFWRGESANLVAAEFQRILSGHGALNLVDFNSVTPLARDDIGDFATVSVRVEGEASYSNLIGFLKALKASTPQIGIAALSFRQLPLQAETTYIPISFQLTLWGVASFEGEP